MLHLEERTGFVLVLFLFATAALNVLAEADLAVVYCVVELNAGVVRDANVAAFVPVAILDAGGVAVVVADNFVLDFAAAAELALDFRGQWVSVAVGGVVAVRVGLISRRSALVIAALRSLASQGDGVSAEE